MLSPKYSMFTALTKESLDFAAVGGDFVKAPPGRCFVKVYQKNEWKRQEQKEKKTKEKGSTRKYEQERTDMLKMRCMICLNSPVVGLNLEPPKG